ncbi:F-box protein-like protein [Tanacetum coccineum]
MKKITRRGSRKKENVDHFALLPDDVVVLILRKLPVDELRFRVCYVCRQWSNLINHRILVNDFSLIRENNSGSPRHRVVRITEEEGELAVKEQDLEIPYKGKDGFFPGVLFRVEGIMVVNVEWVFPIYDRFKQVYKERISWHDPVSIDGRYLHWNVNSFDYLLSMDTVEERFRRISLPPIYDDNLKNKNQYSICKMGGFLGLHEVSSENDVMWVLKNFERTTWEKLKFIGVTASVDPDRGILIPPIAPRYSRYMVFTDPDEHDHIYYSYDFKDKLVRRLNIQLTQKSIDTCIQHRFGDIRVLFVNPVDGS